MSSAGQDMSQPPQWLPFWSSRRQSSSSFEEREEVAGAQADRARHHALRLRLPLPPDPRLFQMHKYVRVEHDDGAEAWPHVGLCARHRAGRARGQSQVIGFRRLYRPLDRRACALRDRGQRPLRRSDAHPPAARPRARGPDARGLREGTRAGRGMTNRKPGAPSRVAQTVELAADPDDLAVQKDDSIRERRVINLKGSQPQEAC